MGFKKVSYLVTSCDGCGLAWSFGDPGCVDGIPPHFAARPDALEQLKADYGWQIVRRRLGPPLMACRRCAAAQVIPASAGRRWLLWASGWARRYVPFGAIWRKAPGDIPPGHPESVTAVLPAEQEDLLAALDDELFPDW